jgi:hypothetical protein
MKENATNSISSYFSFVAVTDTILILYTPF